MAIRRWDNEDLVEAVKVSTSVRQVCEKLGLRGGGSQKTVDKWIHELGLDISHFVSEPWQGKTGAMCSARWMDDSLIFCANVKYNTNHKRRYLLMVAYECTECGLGEIWNGKKITLQLDHIDGDKSNNVVENLRLLCPNCHSQTPTFARNKKMVDTT